MYRMQKVKPYVIQCMAMNLSEDESIKYLSDRNFKISPRYLYKLKKGIKESRFERLALIAKTEYVDQHLERITTLELVQREFWTLYRKETNTFKKALILEKIAELQTFISPYYQASRKIMEDSIKDESKENRSISTV